jgi:hypothetical protein
MPESKAGSLKKKPGEENESGGQRPERLRAGVEVRDVQAKAGDGLKPKLESLR